MRAKLAQKCTALFLFLLPLIGAGVALGQDVNSVKNSLPLLLKEQGSFYVGGDNVFQDADSTGGFVGAGHVTVNQMYVQYMVPLLPIKVPVVMVHGATLSGKSWETTPDGRMGWNEYFVRK